MTLAPGTLCKRLGEDPSAANYSAALREAQAALAQRFEAEEPIESLVRARAELLDTVLAEAWRSRLPEHDADWSLIAVGGYGRGELHPARVPVNVEMMQGAQGVNTSIGILAFKRTDQ